MNGPTNALRPHKAPAREIFAVGRSCRRPATPEELELARPYRRKGNDARAAVGVLLLHGFTATPASMRGFAEQLHADGYSVSVPLLPGHGTHPEQLLGIDWHAWLAAACDAYDELRSQCEVTFVIGLSLGGALALHLAAQRTDIRQLFLLAPAVYPSRLMQIGVRWLIPLLRTCGLHYWSAVAGDTKRTDGYELAYRVFPLNSLLALHACMDAAQQLLPRITVDTLIFQGRVDHEIPAPKAADILHRLGSQTKELIWLEDSFHEIPRDHEASGVLQRIRAEMADRVKS